MLWLQTWAPPGAWDPTEAAWAESTTSLMEAPAVYLTSAQVLTQYSAPTAASLVHLHRGCELNPGHNELHPAGQPNSPRAHTD